MRTLPVALLLAAATIAALPSASAAEAAQPLPVCVPPASGNGVCVGTIAGNPCVWSWFGPSFNAVCLDSSPPDLLVCDNGGCQSVRDLVVPAVADPGAACVPPGVQSFGVCAGSIAGDPCAWVWLGGSFDAVCLDDETGTLVVCDNDGCRPLLVAQASAAELPVGCGEAVGACVWTDTPNGACVGVHFGLQGAGACVDHDPVAVRACTSMRTILYDGFCPTDSLAVAVDG